LSEQVFKIELKIMSREREPPNDPSSPFKKKEKGGEGRSKAWWPMEYSKLGAQWNVPLFSGQRNVKEKHLFTSSYFPPNNLLKPSIF
jgi:hypothetical protein